MNRLPSIEGWLFPWFVSGVLLFGSIETGNGQVPEGGASVSSLIEVLRSGETQERRDAALALSDRESGSPEIVRALADALGDKDTQVWFHAVTALARFGAESLPAVPALLEGLEGSSRRGANPRWYRSAYALGSMGPGALEELIPALESDVPHVRSGVACALGWLGEDAQPAVSGLVSLLDDSDGSVRQHASETLAKIGDPALCSLRHLIVEPEVQFEVHWALEKMGTVARPLTGPVLELLSESNRDAAATERNADLSIALLRVLIQLDLDPEVHLRAIWPLTAAAKGELRLELTNNVLYLPPELCVPRLIELLGRPDGRDRRWAADLLGHLGEAAVAAVPKLIELATQAPEDEAGAFRDALAHLGPAAADALFNYWSRIEPEKLDPDHWTVQCLGSYGLPVLDKLIAGLGHDRAGVRLAAIYGVRALGSNGRRAVPYLVNSLRSTEALVRAAALSSLVAVARQPDRYRAEILQLLEDEDSGVRRVAVGSVSSLTDLDEIVVDRLEGLLGDEDAGVRLACLQALEKLGGEASGRSARIAALLVEGDPKVRIAVLNALGALGEAPPLALAQISYLAERSSTPVRLAALRSLGRIGTDDPKIVELFRTVVRDSDPSVREAALTGYSTIVGDAAEIVAASLAALEDEAVEIRLAAAANLGEQEEHAVAATGPLIELLEDSQNFSSYFGALRKLPADIGQLEIYVAGMDHSNPAVRAFSCNRLGDLDEHAKPWVEKLENLARNDSYNIVKRSAKGALDNILGRDN